MAVKSYVENGKKLFEVYVNGFDSNGRRVQRRKSGIITLRTAEQVEFELKRDLAKLKEEAVDVRWGEWLKESLKVMKLAFKPSTLYTYEKTLDKWVNKHWQSKNLRSITKMDVHTLIYESMSEDATMNTRRYVLKTVKRILQMAVDNGHLDRNPTQGITIKVPEVDKKVLTNSEVTILLSEAKATNHRFYPIWIVALFTGMRSGELFALRWCDIDLEAGIIHVSRSWSSKNGYASTKNQKTRIVPISIELMQFLKELKLKRGNEESVLPHLRDWRRGDAAQVLRSFCKSLGLTDIRFHDLRATFITNLLSRGESLARVMAMVGHADMDTTNVYLRKAGIELKDATERLGYKVPVAQSGLVLEFPQLGGSKRE